MEAKPHHRPGQLQYSPWTGFNHTSTLDWCEDNYVGALRYMAWNKGLTHIVETRYIAETWNSLSSILFLLLSAYAIKATYGLPRR